jgi:hypothetical protein
MLKYKNGMRGLWHETGIQDVKRQSTVPRNQQMHDPKKNALEQWETKLANTELTPQAIWPIAKYLTNRDGPRAPTAIHGLLRLKYHPVDKANAITDCLENQFTPHDLCDENYERRVEARVQALLRDADSDPPERIWPCDLQNLINSLTLKKACGIDGVRNECLRHLPKRPLVHLTHLINTAFGSHTLTLLEGRNQVRTPNSLKIYARLLLLTGNVFEKIILNIVKRHIGGRNVLNASQFVSRARHSTTLQCMMLTDHVTLNLQHVYGCCILGYRKSLWHYVAP